MAISEQSLGEKLIAGSGYSYFSLLVNKALTTVSTIFLARLLGPTDLGMISIVNYLLLLLLFFTGLGIPTACVKLIAEYNSSFEEKWKVSEFIFSVFILNLTVIIFITFLYFLGASFIAQKIYHEPKLVPLLQISSLAIFFFSVNQYGNAVIQAFAEFGRLSVISIFNSLVGLLLIIPFTSFWGLKGAVIAQALNSFVSFLLILKNVGFLKKKYSIVFPLSSLDLKTTIYKANQYLKQLFAFALPVFLSGLVMTPALAILTTLLTRVRGFTEVGFFNIAYSLVQIILFVPTAVGIPFLPLATKLAVEESQRLKNFLLKTTHSVILIVMLISFLMVFFSSEIIHFFYGREYLQTQNILILMSAAAFLSSFGYIVGYYLLSVGKVWLATLLNFIWFILIVAPAFYFIKFWGLVGLGLDYLIAYTFLTLFIIFYLRSVLKVRIGRIISLLSIGVFFPIIIFLIKIYRFPNAAIINIGLLVIFLILFIRLLPRTIDKAMVREFVKTRINP